jgi:SAM-dependent methyltransferase
MAGPTIMGPMHSDAQRLRATFESAADRYHQARPDYPASLFDELERAARLTQRSKLLEVGCGTGKATIDLARRGYPITCVELGASLADQARRNLAGFPRVQVINDSFEAWQAPPGSHYDLVFAATSWHWVDPAVGYRKASELLRPGGHLAIWSAWHVFPDDGDPFFREIQDVYDEIGESLPPGSVFHRPGELPDLSAEIEGTGLFTVVSIRQFDWEMRYSAEEYIALLGTFSGHIAMAQWQRDRLYSEIRRRLAARPDSTLRRHWGAVLHVARLESAPGPDR